MIPPLLENYHWLHNRDDATLLLQAMQRRPFHRFSLGTLAEKAKLTQAETVQAIELLQGEGVRILATAPGEYALDPKNDRLHPDVIAAQLPTKWWGRRCLVAEQLPSTIDAARRLAGQPPAHGLLVVAEHQSQGRGRQGAAWVSPKQKDLLLTFVVRVRDWTPSLSFLSLYAAVAVARVLDTAYNIGIGVKWPNDLTVNGKKLGGVLVEIDSEQQLVFVSLGLNVLSLPDDWPEQTREVAVSLAMLNDEPWDRNLLLAQLGSTWEALWEGAAQDHGEAVLGYCRRYSTTLGQNVSFRIKGKKRSGFAREIDENGRLVLEKNDGERCAFLLEDVCELRVIGSTISSR
ncbi:MAG: biotin--[acetyl-CoA-carboxylase] ligase [Candidatus Hinthialibacter antarcticus]|nr:biotin--[acetyl-CoA-carboxylase] ligase [Candidatus Hinthialibacter antarcticus]